MTVKILKELLKNCKDTDEINICTSNNIQMMVLDCIVTENFVNFIIEEK